MLSRLLGFLRPKPALVTGTGKLPEGEAKVVALGDPMAGGTEIVLCRRGGKIHVLDRVCPHNEGGHLVGGPLIDGKYVRCPLHNYKFDVETGAVLGAACPSAKLYKSREKDGDTEVWV